MEKYEELLQLYPGMSLILEPVYLYQQRANQN
jgi:hypothetical protein